MSVTPFSICVYCGARAGGHPAYLAAAEQLGQAIAKNDWRLVYGAGDVGIMGTVANAAVKGGAKTLGVIPTHLVDREAPQGLFGDRLITETMHERKKVMFMNADAVAVLPGGAGSLDEFFEVLTWKQLGLHKKPIYLLDIEGYWQPLVHLIDHIVQQGFAETAVRDFFSVMPSIDAMIAELTQSAR